MHACQCLAFLPWYKIGGPRVEKSMENTDSSRSMTKYLDVGVTYRLSLYHPDSGTLEHLIGRLRPSLPPRKNNDINNQSLLQSDKDRRRNHVFICLATGGHKTTIKTPPIKSQFFHPSIIPKDLLHTLSFFLRNKYMTPGYLYCHP